MARFVARGCGGGASLGRQLAVVWPGLASRGCAGGYIFLLYLLGVAISSGFETGRVVSMSKTAAAQRILAPLVCLYC